MHTLLPPFALSAYAPARPLVAMDKLLRSELAAAATYRQAQKHVTPSARALLEDNRNSHESRAWRISLLVRKRFGVPAAGPGSRGTIAKLVEKTASLVSDAAVLKTLHRGERHITQTYRTQLPLLDDELCRALEDPLAEQTETERRMKTLVAAEGGSPQAS